MKISLAFVHKYLISYSCNWTGFPGRFPRTVRERENDQRRVSHGMVARWRAEKSMIVVASVERSARGLVLQIVSSANCLAARCGDEPVADNLTDPGHGVTTRTERTTGRS